jgi:hypothetical protein
MPERNAALLLNRARLYTAPTQVGNLRHSRLGSLRYIIARPFIGRRITAENPWCGVRLITC